MIYKVIEGERVRARTSIYYILLSILWTSSAFAQTATLRGQVSDESGAVIPGARVTLVRPGGLAKATVADLTGVYILAGSGPGKRKPAGSRPHRPYSPLRASYQNRPSSGGIPYVAAKSLFCSLGSPEGHRAAVPIPACLRVYR